MTIKCKHREGSHVARRILSLHWHVPWCWRAPLNSTNFAWRRATYSLLPTETQIAHHEHLTRTVSKQIALSAVSALSLFLDLSIFSPISLQSWLLILASTGNTVRSSASLERCTPIFLSSFSSPSSSVFFITSRQARWMSLLVGYFSRKTNREKRPERESERERENTKQRFA